jgi:hypothetical protein
LLAKGERWTANSFISRDFYHETISIGHEEGMKSPTWHWRTDFIGKGLLRKRNRRNALKDIRRGVAAMRIFHILTRYNLQESGWTSVERKVVRQDSRTCLLQPGLAHASKIRN